jgi:ADP-ribose pyrophosphatase YjhB (NUDIX family)
MPFSTLTPVTRQRLEPFITPLYRTWWRINRGMTLGVRGVAFDGEGKVMLVRHTYRAGWFLPGGGVESGETLIDAVIKEMQEEAGVYADAPPRLFAVYSNHARFKNDHVALFVFDAWRLGPVTQDGEIAEIGLFSPDALPQGTTHGVRARLDEILSNKPIAHHW